MKFLGFEVSVRKQNLVPPLSDITYNGNLYDRGWWPVVQEPFAGAWQQNRPLVMANPLQNVTLYRCISMISADIAKLRLKLMKGPEEDISTETTSPAFSPVMNKPNRYQTRIQFYESWLVSKLRSGNTYVLKERDGRGLVVAMYVLNPHRVKVLRAGDGSVFYELNTDALAQIDTDRVVVGQDDIMHDRINCLFDPLVGMPPLYSASAPALTGLSMEEFSSRFFSNSARPSGILTAPGDIPPAVMERLKRDMEQGYSAVNQGKIAVMGSGLTFAPMQQNAVDSQLIERLKHTSVSICSAYGVPPFMVGVQDPPRAEGSLLDLQYYKQCLQSLIEHIELILSEGLGLLDAGYEAEFDLTGIFRMDSQTQITVLATAVDKGIMTHNEARVFLNLPPEPGGDVLMAQQQMFSLEALANRGNAPPLPAAPAPGAQSQDAPPFNQAALIAAIRRNLDHAA